MQADSQGGHAHRPYRKSLECLFLLHRLASAAAAAAAAAAAVLALEMLLPPHLA